ncbi:hypothetical protein SUDANB58_04478 [Streptomyces sp. enrichment culture]|uniref:hypothetical protein n=1 Tax=Streptomyces sp. enrichment culture TaxID=1795815 RepID=UPI003F5708FE
MKGILGLIGFVLVVGGLQGIVHEAFGTWIPLMGFMRHLYVDGCELYVGIALVVLGVAVNTAAREAPRK